MSELRQLLRDHGLRPTSQRLAVAGYVLGSEQHPTADEVFEALKAAGVELARATVYNTLNTLVGRGLLIQRELRAGSVVFEGRQEPHHHFVDDETGEIVDIPAELIQVLGIDALKDFEVREVQVVIRGRARRGEERMVRAGREGRSRRGCTIGAEGLERP